MKKLLINPLFIIGLLIRAFTILTVYPLPVKQWYVPFLDASIQIFPHDPWANWLSGGGDPSAFPYGYIMLIFFMPLTSLCKLFGVSLAYGYGTTLIASDFALLLLLRKMLNCKDNLLLSTYWLSPIVIVASYFLGFNDLIPVFLLTLSLYFAKNLRFMLCGILYIAAISAKLSMIIALPFFAIYLLHNPSIRRFIPQFTKGLLHGLIFIILPPILIFSTAGFKMLIGNPEIGKIYRLGLVLGNDTIIYLVPLIYMLMLYATWRVKRLNFELFYSLMGISFLAVVLMTPASPGWFIWTIPFLVTYQAKNNRLSIAAIICFSVFYVFASITPQIPYINLHANFNSLIHTAMIAIGIIISARIWRENVSRNDYFRLSRKPFVIGISGDSGAGKDTFSDAIKGLFGTHSVTTISGDDYHLWDRQKPMWQVMTHLNPNANDLERFSEDLIKLTDGKTIQSKHYDHSTGRMSHKFDLKSNDIIIASGLHALYLPILRECYDLSIYLDIDEELRRYFKIQRDVNQRGHTLEKVLSSFEKREADSKNFIRPQASHADLILSLLPINPRILQDQKSNQDLRFKLSVKSRNGLNELSLSRVLVGICGLHVDTTNSSDNSEIEFTIEGEISAQDIELAAKIICPRIFEFLDTTPDWQDGMLGLMQLVAISYINQELTKRFIW